MRVVFIPQIFAMVALCMVGQRHWPAWRDAVAEHVARVQVARGAAAGSWNPADPEALMRGRVWTTALRALTLHFVRIRERR